MKQVIVGTYEYGMGQAQLVLREGTGGEFYIVPEKGSVARIKLGADQAQWTEVLSTLLHEILEMQVALIGCRYSPAPDFGRDHASYLFLMTHPQFSEACGRAAWFLSAAVPDLSKAWAKWNRKAR